MDFALPVQACWIAEKPSGGGLILLPDVRYEDKPMLRPALAWNPDGMDFADLLHLALCQMSERLTTFDHALIKQSHPSHTTVAEP